MTVLGKANSEGVLQFLVPPIVLRFLPTCLCLLCLYGCCSLPQGPVLETRIYRFSERSRERWIDILKRMEIEEPDANPFQEYAICTFAPRRLDSWSLQKPWSQPSAGCVQLAATFRFMPTQANSDVFQPTAILKCPPEPKGKD